MLARVAALLALAAVSTASIVVRHDKETCTASARGTTRHCTQDASLCCPKNWSCVTPSNGQEICVANAHGSSCPSGYGAQGGVCILGANGSGSGSSSSSSQAASGSDTDSASASGTETDTQTSSSGEFETSIVTSSSVSTSLSTSGTETIPVPVTVPITYPVTISSLPPPSGELVIVPTTSISVSTSFSTSGSATVPVPIDVPVPSSYSEIVVDGTTSVIGEGSSSGSVTFFPTYSTSGSVTIPITTSATITTASDGSIGTAPPNNNAPTMSSNTFAVVGAVVLAMLAL